MNTAIDIQIGDTVIMVDSPQMRVYAIEDGLAHCSWWDKGRPMSAVVEFEKLQKIPDDYYLIIEI